MSDEIRAALDPIADALDEMGIVYRVGGSVASSAFGIARTTLDIDLVADLRASQVADFVARVESAYYVDADVIYDAIRRRSCFNLIHLATMVKIDVFVLKSRSFDRQAFSRHVDEPVGDNDERRFPFTTAEDMVIHKLEWFRAGGETSQRQWADVLGVLRLQGNALDLPYLTHWAAEVGVDDLLARALVEARLD
jgi:hypothetical protein